MRVWHSKVAVLGALLLCGCEEVTPPSPEQKLKQESQCLSEQIWNGNEQESPLMHPGVACVACHSDHNAASGDGDAPIFAVAGTVYTAANEPDNCISSVALDPNIVTEVIIDDAANVQYRTVVNATGNFMLDETNIVWPVHVTIRQQGRERRMQQAVSNGDCNSCHTATATMGRILSP